MKIETPERFILGFRVMSREDASWPHFGEYWLEPVYVDAGAHGQCEKSKVKLVDTDSALHGFRIECSYRTDSPDRGAYGRRYGYQDVFSVDAMRAETMCKVFRHISRHLERVATKYGHPTTFGQYATRIIEALGGKCLLAPMASDANWHNVETRQGDMVCMIDYRLEKRLAELTRDAERAAV